MARAAKGTAKKGRGKTGKTIKDFQRGDKANGYEMAVDGDDDAGEGHNSKHFDPNGPELSDFLELVAEECNRAKPGTYKVTVVLYSNHYHGRRAVPFTVHCRLGDHEEVFRGKLTRRGSDTTICEFRVAANGTFSIKKKKKK